MSNVHRGLAAYIPAVFPETAFVAAAVVFSFWAVDDERMMVTMTQEVAHSVAGLSTPKLVSVVIPNHQELRVIESETLHFQCLLDTQILRITAK